MVAQSLDKAAWAVVLTSTNKYIQGALKLAASLQHVQSAYPLLVLYTPAVSHDAREKLKEAGCIMREVAPVKPRGKVKYFTQRFEDTWTKLTAWNVADHYERLVLLDADMLVLKNMDELMKMNLGKGEIAACYACKCNPHKIKAYPADWTPENCAYTTMDEGRRDYFNSGMIVLRPSPSTFQTMLTRLYGIRDLNIYPFPDQDFLNEFFAGHWQLLPYTYNALKTLPYLHPDLWDLSQVKVLHYIIDKPWDKSPSDPSDGYTSLYRLWWEAPEA